MDEWHCFHCGSGGNIGNFCSMCGGGKRDFDAITTKEQYLQQALPTLTLEEKATNADTWEHINMVAQLLLKKGLTEESQK